MEPLHKRLKRLRTARGLTAKQLASAIRVPESTYREWEYGRTLSGHPFVKIAEALGVSISALMTGETIEREWIISDLEVIEKQVQALKTKVLSRI